MEARKKLMRLLAKQGARKEFLPQVIEALTGRAVLPEELKEEEIKRALEEVQFIQRALDRLDVSEWSFWPFWLASTVRYNPPREALLDYVKTLIF